MKPTHHLTAHTLVKVGQQYLVMKRTKIKRGRPNGYPEQWDTPGGAVEPGELPSLAAIRETKEEVNLDINLGNVFYETSRYVEELNMVFTVLFYHCELKDDFKLEMIKLDPEEHSEFRLINCLEDLKGEKVIPSIAKVIEDDYLANKLDQGTEKWNQPTA